MKALVLNELHFFKDSNGIFWTERLTDYSYFTRYLNAFESISICARVSYIEKAKTSFLRVSGQNVNFVELPDSYGIKQTIMLLKRTKKIFRQALHNHDAVITRAPSMLMIFLYSEIKKSGLPFSIDVALSGKKMIPSEGLFAKIANKIIDCKLKKMCQEAQGVSYVTEYVLQKEYPCKAMYTDDGYHFTGSFSTLELKEEYFRKPLWDSSSPPTEFIVTNCGFMDDDRKCQKYLLQAFSNVVKKGYNAKLWLIGDGALRPQYEQLAQKLGIYDKCVFYGLVSNKMELLKLLRKSHIFVFPTKAEGLPRSILEAMAQGLPCISSPVDGVPELIDSNYLVDWWDSDGLSEKIESLLSHWEDIISLGNHNYKKARLFHNDILKEKRTVFYSKLRKICEGRQSE